MREREQVPSLSHTWLPYITPNGVRLTHETLIILSKIVQKNVDYEYPTQKGLFMAIPFPFA